MDIITSEVVVLGILLLFGTLDIPRIRPSRDVNPCLSYPSLSFPFGNHKHKAFPYISLYFPFKTAFTKSIGTLKKYVKRKGTLPVEGFLIGIPVSNTIFVIVPSFFGIPILS